MKLYHFTCSHGMKGIEATGEIRPNPHLWMPELGPVVWLTDLREVENRDDLGLTMNLVKCDRTEFRLQVKTSRAVPWVDVAGIVDPEVRESLETFSKPEHWWISRRPCGHWRVA